MKKKTYIALHGLVLLLLPFMAFTLTVPGMIEAEAYNSGGEGVGFHDTGTSPVTESNSDSTGNGIHIAYIESGEWLAYTVTATAGYYNVEVRVAKDASAPAGGSFHIEFGGTDVSGLQAVPATGGWTTFATMIVGPIEVVTGGSQVMKIMMDGGPFNLNWVNFVATSESPTPSPSPTPAPTVSPQPPVVRPLHVEGQYIKDDAGSNVKLHGVSIGDLDAIYKGDRKTDSTQAVPITVEDIIDKGSDWNINAWRLPVHADVNDETGHHGWNVRNNPQWFFDNIIEPAVSKVISVGDYAIIDWHYVGVSWDDATVIAKTEEFWLGNGTWPGIAAMYANNPNVIFELFNEPGGGSWSSWKTRAGGWINSIRGVGANNLIIVGGPGWSQTLPQSAGDLFSAANIAYACHIYPQHVGSTMPNWIEYTSSVAPVVMTEWGFENTGPAPVSGTASAYGTIYKAYINGKPNVSWIAWCFDYIYHSYMFDTNWTLLGNGNATASTLYFGASGIDKGSHGITAPADTSQNFMGQFTKNWLAEQDNLPTSAPTVVPTPGPTEAPTAVPTVAPTAAPTVVPTIAPTVAPTGIPTITPTTGPTTIPTVVPTIAPTVAPTPVAPTAVPGGCDMIATTQPVQFGTTGAVCFRTQAVISGWGVSNFDGRTVSVTVNGTGVPVTTAGGALPAKGTSDYYYFQSTAGTYAWAAIYWW
jgi:hypothetical protein